MNNSNQRSAVEAVKSAGSSTLFLAALITYTASLILQLAQAVYNPQLTELLGSFGELQSLLEPDSAYITIPDGINIGMISMVSSLALLILPGVICAGMWMFYTASRGHGNEDKAITGLKMIKVSVIIQYVFVFLMVALVVVALVIIMAVAGSIPNYYSSDIAYNFLTIFVAVAVISVAAGVVVGVFMLRGIIKTANIAIGAYKTGILSGRVSMFVIVMNYISAGSACISSLSYSAMGRYGLYAVLPLLCNAAFLILLSICLSSFRETMKRMQ